MKKYNGKDLTGIYTISTKLDGIHAHWTGVELLTRNGKPIRSVPHVVSSLIGQPEVHGELYNHDMIFERINGASRSHGVTDDSRLLKFYPHEGLHLNTWYNPTREELDKLMNHVVGDGYEGIVITSENGDMMKHKPRMDSEYKLVGFEPGKTDRNASTFGSLILRLENGRTFKCSGLTDQQRADLWDRKPIGAMVKVSFDSLTKNNVPRFPSFECVRWDLY